MRVILTNHGIHCRSRVFLVWKCQLIGSIFFSTIRINELPSIRAQINGCYFLSRRRNFYKRWFIQKEISISSFSSNPSSSSSASAVIIQYRRTTPTTLTFINRFSRRECKCVLLATRLTLTQVCASLKTHTGISWINLVHPDECFIKKKRFGSCSESSL